MTLSITERDAMRGMLKQAVRTRSRRPVGAVVAALAAVPIVAAVVVASILLPPSGPASAAEALEGAAHHLIATSDPVVGPGQYLKVTTEAAYLAYESAADGRLTAYLSPSTTEVWIPADASGAWTQRETFEPATAFYGSESKVAAARDWKDTVAQGVVRVSHAANGEFVKVHELGGEVTYGDLPDTPPAALAYLRATPDPSDLGAFLFAAQLLRDGTMKAADRAVVYQALALLPGIRITDDQAVLDGRTGTAFSIEQGDINRTEIIVDDATGQYIGERETSAVDQGSVPANSRVAYTAVRTEVVDTAP